MHAAGGNANKGRNRAAQIEKCVQLDGGFVLAEMRPGEEGQAQIDGRGIQSVHRLVQLDAEGIVE